MDALVPLLFVLPCLLMVVMMLRGHGHGHGGPVAHAAGGADDNRPCHCDEKHEVAGRA
jgi:hypothetical protein